MATGGISLLGTVPGARIFKLLKKISKPVNRFFASIGDDMLEIAVRTNGIPKFTGEGIEALAKAATKNGSKTKVMLGKWDNGLPSSYVTRAGDEYAYFQLDEWDDLLNVVDGSDDEIWKINKHFLDEQDNLGKSFYFSHNPYDATGYFKDEIDYLKNSLNVKSFTQVGDNLWKANK